MSRIFRIVRFFVEGENLLRYTLRSLPPSAARFADGSGGLFQALYEYFSFPVIVGQPARSMEQGQIPVCIAMHSHSVFYVVTSMAASRNLQDQPLETYTVIRAHRAVMLLSQNIVEAAAIPRYEGRAFFLCGACKLGIECR